MSYVKIEGTTNLVKDTSSGAILNTDKTGLQKALALKEARKNQKEEIEEIKQKVSDMENKLDRILSLLSEDGK